MLAYFIFPSIMDVAHIQPNQKNINLPIVQWNKITAFFISLLQYRQKKKWYFTSKSMLISRWKEQTAVTWFCLKVLLRSCGLYCVSDPKAKTASRRANVHRMGFRQECSYVVNKMKALGSMCTVQMWGWNAVCSST